MDLLKRVANYFAYEYQGDDKTAPEFRVCVDDLREIANINVDKCRLETVILLSQDWRKCICYIVPIIIKIAMISQ